MHHVVTLLESSTVSGVNHDPFVLLPVCIRP